MLSVHFLLMRYFDRFNFLLPIIAFVWKTLVEPDSDEVTERFRTNGI